MKQSVLEERGRVILASITRDCPDSDNARAITSAILLLTEVINDQKIARQQDDDVTLAADDAAQLGSEAENLLGVDGRDASETLFDFRPPPGSQPNPHGQE